MSRVLTILFSFIILLISSAYGQGLTYEDQVHDFGHVGIDFRLFHDFEYTNKTDKPVKINNIDVACDCSEVNFSDSTVNPGETLKFKLIFSTKDYYGPTNKHFTVHTDDPTMPEFTYFYQSIVGQWYDALKPDPISLFFLPKAGPRILKIQNQFFDELNISGHRKYDNSFEYEIVEDEADKGEYLTITVKPSDNLSAGTHFSVLEIEITGDGDKKTVLSVPVKIVKY